MRTRPPLTSSSTCSDGMSRCESQKLLGNVWMRKNETYVTCLVWRNTWITFRPPVGHATGRGVDLSVDEARTLILQRSWVQELNRHNTFSSIIKIKTRSLTKKQSVVYYGQSFWCLPSAWRVITQWMSCVIRELVGDIISVKSSSSILSGISSEWYRGTRFRCLPQTYAAESAEREKHGIVLKN